jgi:hypothetical protein
MSDQHFSIGSAPRWVNSIVRSTVKFQPSRAAGLLITFYGEPCQHSNTLRRSVRNKFQYLLSSANSILCSRTFSRQDLVPDSKLQLTKLNELLGHELPPCHFRTDEFFTHVSNAAFQLTKPVDCAPVGRTRTHKYSAARSVLERHAFHTLKYTHCTCHEFIPYNLRIFIGSGVNEVHRSLRREGIKSQRRGIISPFLKSRDPRTNKVLFLPSHERINHAARSYMLKHVIDAVA